MPQEKIVSFFYLKIFALLFFVIVVVAIIARLGHEIISSTFQNNSFSLLYVSKDTKILFVDKNGKKASFTAVGDIQTLAKGKNSLEISLAIGVPISCVVIDPHVEFSNIDEFVTFKNEMKLLTSSSLTYKGCNRYDMHKLIGALRGIPEDNRKIQRINLFGSDIAKIKDVFRDSIVTNMEYTIQIENGTGINGLGSTMAMILGNVGFNVIAVRTVNTGTDSFIAYNGEKNLVTDTLIELTDFEFRKEKIAQAADITIRLGDDLGLILDD